MPPAERTAVLRDFAAGRTPILVSTTVVEVGVDVPEATLMIVENAEVFGLAQLHQLRGRVGRSERRSWCALIVGREATPEARERLKVLEETSDGFVIAEKDLEARGMGDLLGSRQSGLPAMRVADPVRDLAALGEARRRVVALRERGDEVRSDLFGYPPTKSESSR
jgi:ATP-dependent DNA helicase RecG